jgi:hypothetical protein
MVFKSRIDKKDLNNLKNYFKVDDIKEVKNHISEYLKIRDEILKAIQKKNNDNDSSGVISKIYSFLRSSKTEELDMNNDNGNNTITKTMVNTIKTIEENLGGSKTDKFKIFINYVFDTEKNFEIVRILPLTIDNLKILKEIVKGADSIKDYALYRYDPIERQMISITAIARLKQLGFFDTEEGQSFIREELQHIISNQTSKVICVLIKVLKNKDLLKSIAEGTDNALQKYSPTEQEEISTAAIERLKELGYIVIEEDKNVGNVYVLIQALEDKNMLKDIVKGADSIKDYEFYSDNPTKQEEISIAAIERLKELGYFDTDEGQAFLIRTASKKINNNNLYLALIQNIKKY